MKKIINEKNLNFPRMLFLNEQNDPKPQHQLTSELEAANVSRGEKALLSSDEKLPQFPARYWRWLKIVWNFGDAARRFSMRGFQRFGCNDARMLRNESIPPSRLPIFPFFLQPRVQRFTTNMKKIKGYKNKTHFSARSLWNNIARMKND